MKVLDRIKQLFAPSVRFAALLAFVCAAGSAWAVNKPLAVWNGDFVAGESGSRGGFTIDLNNGTATENLNTIANNVITIGSGANGGVRFTTENSTYRNIGAVIGINANGYDFSTTSGPGLISFYNTRSGRTDIGVIYLRKGTNQGEFSAAWCGTGENKGAGYGNQGIYYPDYNSVGSNIHYLGAVLAATGGTFAYLDGDSTCPVVSATEVACGYTNERQKGVTLGGMYSANTRNMSGATINYVAIFANSTQIASGGGNANAAGNPETLAAWSLTSMTGSPTTDINTTDSTVGVNLPASATLTATATPAAVFVQQTSTLTVTGSGSLNINSGNGPLYVADGTTLTIDATGISGLSGAGDSVTLVSGKIYGTDLISVNVPVVAGCKVTPTITETGIKLTCVANSVTFTSPFTGLDLTEPTTATGWGNSADQISFGNKSQFSQTVGVRSATVADVIGGSYSTAINGFLTTAETATSADKDTYLRVSGVSARLVCGVQKCGWVSPGTYQTTGDAITQIDGNNTYIQYVFGAGSEGGYNSVTPKVTGNTGVTVKGNAVITGSVIGGWGSSHIEEPEVTGNTAVRIECVQNQSNADALNYIPAGWIIGGSTYQANGAASKTKVSGNSSVTVDLDDGATGTFSKNLLGASLLPDTVEGDANGQTQTVSGNSSVMISAPAGVTFSGKIVGGGYSGRLSSGGSSIVGGNSSVTIDGGTYTGTIVAGGYAPDGGNVSVAGTATLTLNGGVFTSATLKAGVASGAKSLVIGGDVSLPAAAVNNSGFDGLSVSASKRLTLGTERLLGATYPALTSVGAEGKVSFQLTSAEETDEHAVLINCSVADMTGKFTILDSNGDDITSSVADKVSVRNGYLVYMDVNTYTVTIGSGETAWDSVSWTLDGSSVTMATAADDVNAEATITLDGGTLVISDAETFAGKLTINGTGTLKFTGSATLTSGLDITIGSGVALDFSGLTNLTNMGRGDTIISAVAITVDTSSITFPSTWTCTYSASGTSFNIEGFITESDSVSINIVGGAASRSGKRITSGDAGFYPVSNSQWNQTAEKTTTDAVSVSEDVSERLAGGDLTQEAGMVATVSANNAYTSGAATTGANAELMYGYLDDGGTGASITVKNIPYSEYAVLVYMGTDVSTDEKNFRPVTVNGTSYCGSGSTTVAGSSNWGVYTSARGNVTLAEGSNYLKVIGQTSSTLTVQGSTGDNGYRCGIAGIQIVNTGTRQTIYAATLDGAEGTLLPSGESTGMTKTSVGSWSGSSTAKIILTNPADANSTVTIGENINTGSLKIRGAGTVTLAIGDSKTLTINDGKVDLTEFSGTLCVDPTVPYSFFAANETYKTNNGIVRFIGENLEFTNETSLPFGKIAFDSATLKGSLASTYRTVVVEDGDSVTIDSTVKKTSLNFDVRGGLLTIAATDKFWFGAGSTFTQTGGMVKWECTGTETTIGGSSCGIFGYSSTGATVSISGGIFDMSKATLNVWISGSSLTLSGDAQFKVMGIIANGTAGRTVSVGGSSKLILTGTLGLHTSLATVTLSGGTIELQETATIEKQLTLAASTESAIIVAASKTATLSGGVTGTGTLKLAGAGTIANSTALTNVGAIDFTDGLTVNTPVTLAGGAVISVGDDDVTIGDAVTQSGSLVIDGSAITSGDPNDTITISASSGTFTVANVSTRNMPGSWTLDTANSSATELRLVASEVAKVGENSYATIAAAIAAANSGETKTVTLTSNTGDSSTPVTIPAGVAVNFGSYTLTCGTLTVGAGVVVDMAHVAATKVEGSGTVIYDGTYPASGLGWTDADNWRGTLVIKSISTKQGLVLNNIGNENSVVRLDGVSDAYFDGSQEAKPTLDLDGSGLTLHYANSDNVVILSKLTGSGPLSITGGSSSGAAVVVKESSLFTGAITLQSGCQQQLIFGDSGSDATTAKIIVNSGKIATVPTGKIWSAAGGFEVNGTLAIDGTGSVGSNVTTANGSTLDLSGFTGTAPAISGLLTLASGTTIKLPAGADLSTGYQVASSGGSGFINATVQIDGGSTITENIRFDSGTIYEVSPVEINTNDKTYTVSEVFGTPTATSDYVINVTATATMTVPGTAVRTVTYNFTVDGNTITLADGYKVDASTINLKITDASSLTAGNYTLFQWTTPQRFTTSCTGYGTFASVDTTGLASELTAEVVYGAKAIYLRVYNTATQAARKPLVIWPYGDSITEGYNADHTGANYRILLYQKLRMLGYNVKSTGVYGLDDGCNAVDPSGTPLTDDDKWHSAKASSFVSAGLRGNIAECKAALIENVDTLSVQAGTPDVVLLHIGVNDLNGFTEDVESVFRAWSNVVDRLVRNLPTSKIVVSTALHGREPNKNATNARVDRYNAMIKALMDDMPTEWSGHVVLADLCSIVQSQDTGILYSDHVHPDWWGHDQMAEGWLAKIVELYNDPTATNFPSQAALPAIPDSSALGAENKSELADYRAGFTKYGDISIERGKDITNIDYDNVDDSAAASNIGRVGYFVEYVRTDNHAHKWVWVDMDAFGDRDIAAVGLPSANHQQVVKHLHVYSNHGAIDNVAADDDTVSGFIEFTPYNVSYTASNVEGAPADSGPNSNQMDWNDTVGSSGLFAAMQVFRIAPPSGRPAQTIFAFNNWRSFSETGYTPAAEFGIGNFAQHFWSNNIQTLDYIYTYRSEKMNADAYTVKNIEIWTKPVYTAPMSATGNFSGLGFSPALPSDISECDLIVNVTEDATLTFDSAKTVGTITFNIAENKTLTLDGTSNLTVDKIIVNGPGKLAFNASPAFGALRIASNATIALASGQSITLTGALTVDSDVTLTMEPASIDSHSAAMISAGSVVNNGTVALTAPDSGSDYSVGISGTAVTLRRVTKEAFTYNPVPSDNTPTGWITEWGSGNPDYSQELSTTSLRIGPSGDIPYVYHTADGCHPWREIAAKTSGFSYAIYADVANMESDKGVIASFGDTTKGLFLYRVGDYIKLAHVVNGNITTSDWVPGVPVSAGYHLYTATFDPTTGAATLYLDDGSVYAATDGSTHAHLGTEGLNAGFQLGAVFGDTKYDEQETGFHAGVGMAVCAMRGYDVVLLPVEIEALSDSFPATNGGVTWNVTPDNADNTVIVTSTTFGDSNYIGQSKGTLTIPAGSEVNVKHIRVLNNNLTDDRATVNIAGTLNITSTSTDPNTWADRDSNKGVLFGHYHGQGTYNITGSLLAENTYIEVAYTAEDQLLDIDGGTVKTKALYAQYGNGTHTVKLHNGGTLEVSEILSTGHALTKEFKDGTFRITADATETRAINFSAASGYATTLDPYGHTLTLQSAALTGSGNITVRDSSTDHDGIVVFPASSTFGGSVILTDANAANIDISSYTGKIVLRGTASTTIAKLNRFTGVIVIDAEGEYDATSIDLSRATIEITHASATLRATAGREGNVAVVSGNCCLYVDNNTFLYDGHIFTGGVNDTGATLTYYHSEASTTPLSWSKGDVFSVSELAEVKSGNNIAPYFKIFHGHDDGDNLSGSMSTATDWNGLSVGDSAPTSGNMAIHVTGGKTLTVEVPYAVTFGEVQVFGSGTVVFTGAAALTVTKGMYITPGTVVEANPTNLAFSGDGNPGIHVDYGLTEATSGKVILSGGTSESSYAPYIYNQGAVEIAEGAYVSLANQQSNVSYLTVSGTATVRAATSSLVTLTITSSGVLNVPAGATVSPLTLTVDGVMNMATSTSTLSSVAALEGTGTVAYVGKTPDGSWWTTGTSSTGWRGTLEIENVNVGTTLLSDLGNANSKIKLSGVQWYSNAGQTIQAEVIMDNDNGSYEYALNITTGTSGKQATFNKISGAGTIKSSFTGTTAQNVYAFVDATGFTGSISQANAAAGRLAFKTNSPGSGYESACGTITVYSGSHAKIGDGKSWTPGPNGVVVKDSTTVEMLGAAAMNGVVTLNGGSTLKFDDIGTSSSPKKLTLSSTLTFASGTVNIALGDGVPATLYNGAVLIDWTTAGVVPDGTFAFADLAVAAAWDLQKTTTGLVVASCIKNTDGDAVGTMADGIVTITNPTGTITIPEYATGLGTVVNGTSASFSYAGSGITDANKASTITVYPTDANGAVRSGVSASTFTDYFTISVSSGTRTITVTLNADMVRPGVNTSAASPISGSGVNVQFAVPMKAGLWYAVESGTTLGEGGALSGTTAYGTAATSDTDTVSTLLPAPLPASGAAYYKVVVGASKASVSTPTP